MQASLVVVATVLYSMVMRQNGFVHVDWGWNYSSNGWHKLNVLRPGQEGIGGGSGGYSSDQQMLRYLKPDRNDDPDPEPNPNPEPKPDPQPDVETGTKPVYCS